MGQTYSITSESTAGCTIIVGEQASPSEIYAGKELQHYLQQITGVLIPILSDSQPTHGYEIVVGNNKRLAAIEPAIRLDHLGDEGFLIRTVENKLIIAGGALRGTLYGVYHFLENYAGCRWFTSTYSHIPKRDSLEIEPIDEEQVPVLEYRETYYREAITSGDWAVKNKLNGYCTQLKEHHGGRVEYSSSWVHSFDYFIPVKEFFESHPEYFSEIDGQRISERTQLCLTNPDVLRLMIERVKAYIEKNPSVKIVSVSQNDYYNACRCSSCSAVDEHEGSQSGTLIHFVNKVAEAIEQDYPHVAIDTLAYQYSRKAPKYVRPRHNVIVRLCSIECCFSHPLESCKVFASFKNRPESRVSASFADDLADWGKISNRLYIWDYVVDFVNYVMPFPNFRVLQPNIQFFIRNSVKGIFEQGNGESTGGEFSELRAYVLAKLLWNPECNVDVAINEFMGGYYGLAAPILREYLDMMHDKVEHENIHLGIYDPPTSDYLTKDILERAKALFDQAEKVADSPEILKRVQKARLPIRYVELSTMPLDVPNRPELVEQFFQDLASAGITRIWEFFPIEESRKLMDAGEIYIQEHNR